MSNSLVIVAHPDEVFDVQAEQPLAAYALAYCAYVQQGERASQ
ncbi:hypothetical protein [Brenneria alni]|nr:hypothetical protein [Brenneria alni]